MGKPPLTYEQSGVSIDAQDRAIDRFKARVQSTHGPEVMAGIGSFGAAFAPDLQSMAKPLIVSSTDGVGTKVKLHSRFGTHSWAGMDLAAAVVNDVVCSGAKPAFFLDYLACNKVSPEVIEEVVGGIAQVCGEIGCALIGGEIAEMGDVYQPGEYDLAGFAVGIVDEPVYLNSSRVAASDAIVGIASSGVHCNGFSLVRSAIGNQSDEYWTSRIEELGASLRDTLLAPTLCYSNLVSKLVKTGAIKASAHISGGGLVDNLPRAIPENLSAMVSRQSIPVPPIFDIIQRLGNVEPDEMWHVFNMGVGFAVITPAACVADVISAANCMGQVAFQIGEVAERQSGNGFAWQN